jgi:simple sugar transport system ATP-binding protein
VLVYPTQGVDVAAKVALFGLVAAAQAGGTGALLISDEIDELQGCDRILVIHKGRLVREFHAGWSERELVAAMEGV